MNTSLSDEELIKQHLESNTGNCFDCLYKRYARKVYKQCLYITKNTEQAQDFTHDIFIRIFSSLDSFQGRSSFSTWLSSVVYYYCLDQIKRMKRMATVTLPDDFDCYCTCAEEGEHTDFLLQQLSHVMRAIKPKDAMMLKLKYQDGLPVSQIGLQMNLKESAVKMRLKRSRNKVRELCQTPRYYLY